MQPRQGVATVPIFLPRDASGFVRRRCGGCRRHFKARWRPGDEAMLQRALLAQVEHANADEAPGVEHRHCPYCGRRAAPEAFLTEAQETFVRGYASALEADVRYERLRQVHERLDLNPYVTFALVRGEQVLPRLPAEADDMRRVAVVCCGDELKLRGNLDGGFFCHQCGIRHASSG